MPGQLAASSTHAAPFIPPANYREFLEREPRWIRNFLKSRNCPQALFEDFEQSLHTHLMSIGKTGASRGHADRIAEYAPDLRGNATSRWAWADWLNTILGREYGKLIARNRKGGIRGENVVSISDGPLETITVLDRYDRQRLLDEGHKTQTTRMFVSTFLDYLKEEGGETMHLFAKNLMVYDSVVEVAKVMNLTMSQASNFRRKMRDIAARFNRGC